jgi:hypothetical protein
MQAFPGSPVEPDTRGAVKGTACCAPLCVIRVKLGDEVWSIGPQPFPGVLSTLIKHAVERRAADDLATRTAALARIDHSEAFGRADHRSTPEKTSCPIELGCKI